MQHVYAERAVIGTRLVEGVELAINDSGVIGDVREAPGTPEPWLAGLVVVPGYVDTHCHGGAGTDFAADDADGVAAAIEYHRRHGTTTLFASTVSESMDDLVDQVGRLRRLVEAGELDGIHLEGPFLALEKKGAHNPALLCDPTPERVERLLAAAGGTLRQITIAPERDHGLEAIATFSSHGVHAAFGHSDADADITRASLAAGVTVATHLFNAMRSIHHRNPGPVPVLLVDHGDVLLELICDGVHLNADIVRMAIDAAGVDRIALVTDAMSATGQADGDYDLGTLKVQVRSGVARLATDDGQPGAIAGSTLTMASAFQFVVSQAGRSLVEAAQMAATNPARHYGLDHVGAIEGGRRADLCAVTERGELVAVMRGGEWVRRP